MVAEHISDVLARPAVVSIRPNLQILRFESMKVASALTAVRQLLDDGTINEDSILVDSSSGVYAYALALVAHRFGLRCHIVGSTTIDPAQKQHLLVLGATIDQVPPSNSLGLDQNRRIALVRQYLVGHPDAYWMQQYHDQIHYQGYADIAAAVLEHLAERPVTVVGGVGSGASTGGLARALRAKGSQVSLVGIQPFGSVSFDSGHISDPDMLVAGIGSSIHFKNIDYDAYSEIHWLSFGAARLGTQRLLSETGIYAGYSSGASFLVSDFLAAQQNDRMILSVAPDTGFRYGPALLSQEGVDWEVRVPTYVTHTSELRLPWTAMTSSIGFAHLAPTGEEA